MNPMVDDRPPAPDEQRPVAPARRTATTMREVAERTVATATNLLATGLILIAGLVVGRHMLAWWNDAASRTPGETLSPATGPSASSLGGPAIQFGDLPGTLVRSETEGDLEVAMSALRRVCGQAAGQATAVPPDTSTGLRTWLAMLADREPVAKRVGEWAMYEWRVPFPMVTVVTDQDRTAVEGFSNDCGILSWGIALPAEPGSAGEPRRWVCFALAPQSSPSAGQPGFAFEVPDDCRRTLALSDGTESLVGFTSPLPPPALIDRWNALLRDRGWQLQGAWRNTGSSWHGRYLHHGRATAVDVQFSAGVSESEKLAGFCRLAPIAD